MSSNLRSIIQSFKYDGIELQSSEEHVQSGPIEDDKTRILRSQVRSTTNSPDSTPDLSPISPRDAISRSTSQAKRYSPVKSPTKNKITKTKQQTSRRSGLPSVTYDEAVYNDLPPSIRPGLVLLFIGYNPGVQSSLQQHHYAHFTNLFWKLFNQADLLIRVLKRSRGNIKTEESLETYLRRLLKSDKLLSSELLEPKEDNTNTNDRGGSYSMSSKVKSQHDFELVNYNIGFTDLVLRCTRTAQELTMQEKLDNVPRLISEFKSTEAQHLVFVGKGIWEIMVKYLAKVCSIPKFSLTKENFAWGRQTFDKEAKADFAYRHILRKFVELCGYNPRIYVFPNTSGLVTSLNYAQKLQLWNDLGEDVSATEEK